MPTPRKRWLKLYVEDVLDCPKGHEETYVRLRIRALLTQQFAEGATPEENGRLVVHGTRLEFITGKGRCDVAWTLLQRGCDVAGMSLQRCGDVATIFWPNYAEFQESDTRVPAARRPRKRRSVAVAVALSQERTPERVEVVAEAPTPLPPAVEQPVLPLVERKPAVRKQGRPPRAKTPAPERFSDEQRLLIRAWARSEYPEVVPQLLALEAACLDYFRGEGKLKVDWIATFRTWVRREGNFTPRRTALQQIRGGRAQPGDPNGIWELPEDPS